MTRSWWKTRADVYLRELFVPGRPPPSRKALIAAYPFGERRLYPYKAWLARVKEWRLAHAAGLASPDAFTTRRHRQHALDTETLPLFPTTNGQKRRTRASRVTARALTREAPAAPDAESGGADHAVQPEDHRGA